jgi:hypothetical protein
VEAAAASSAAAPQHTAVSAASRRSAFPAGSGGAGGGVDMLQRHARETLDGDAGAAGHQTVTEANAGYWAAVHAARDGAAPACGCEAPVELNCKDRIEIPFEL